MFTKKLVVFSLLLFSFSTTINSQFRGELEVYRGQGVNVVHFLNTLCQDAILLESNGKFALVDGAEPDINAAGQEILERYGHARYIADYILRVTNGAGKLEFVIVTHPHVDHLGGLNQILKDPRITVGKAFSQKQSAVRGHYATFLDVATQRSIEVISDDLEFKTITLGDMKITLLNTLSPERGNFGSMMQLVEVSGFNTLLMADVRGDSIQAAEINSVLRAANAKLDIVKVGHHGLRGDMPAAFLRLLPQIDVAIYTNHEQWVDGIVWQNIANHGAKQYITSVFGGVASVFDAKEINHFAINEDPYTEDGFYGRRFAEDVATSQALPAGMKLVWADEFNDAQLDTTKWFTDYYSTIDFVNKTNYEKMRTRTLPQPGVRFTGNSIVLFVDDETPAEPYWRSGRKISSIQTYDWRTDSLLLDNRLGGFFEARIKRSATADAEMLNGAFWFDAPGPDARYFVEKGNNAHDVSGVRPRGQVFEIDLCEYMNTEIVLHGNVSPEGVFQRNIGHHIVRGVFRDRWVVHSMLWTPAGLKFYVDGQQVVEFWNPHDIKSPNYAMSVLMGMYARGGTSTMEVDYIRYYHWDLGDSNHLPNPGFEYHAALFPWEGTGKVSSQAARTGTRGVELAPGDSITQFVYLDHSQPYLLKFWSKGAAGNKIEARVKNITQVSGATENSYGAEFIPEEACIENEVRFSTTAEFGNHKKTVKVVFRNTGRSVVAIDDIRIEKTN